MKKAALFYGIAMGQPFWNQTSGWVDNTYGRYAAHS
jgi:hypothetical protein